MAARKKVTPDVPRYCTVGDDSGHEYFCPVDRKEDFYKWVYSDDDSETPAYATRIDGRLTFADPKVD